MCRILCSFDLDIKEKNPNNTCDVRSVGRDNSSVLTSITHSSFWRTYFKPSCHHHGNGFNQAVIGMGTGGFYDLSFHKLQSMKGDISQILRTRHSSCWAISKCRAFKEPPPSSKYSWQMSRGESEASTFEMVTWGWARSPRQNEFTICQLNMGCALVMLIAH